MSNGAHITHGTIFKVRGQVPLLVCNRMELEEAQKSGLRVMTDIELGFSDILESTENDVVKATALFWSQVLSNEGLDEGRVGLYGTWQINLTLALYDVLFEEVDEYDFVAETSPTIFDKAMLTKDDEELQRIQSVAERTNETMQAVWDFIAGLRADGNYLVNEANEKVTIGDIKTLVRRELMARGLEDTGMIFAQGRDAGFPHSRGENDMPLEMGKSIVFDLFPRELGGGYHHDMTRTWCIGYAPSDVQALYDTVMEAFDISLESYGLNKPTHTMQEAVLDYFEAKGHPTSRTNNRTMDGYMHSLGHGVGINIHESPAISHIRRVDVFEVGNAITIEPGLYYPDRGMGVRVEDFFIINENGELISITPFRKDLVIPIEGVS
jgi:Xaa-Pro aminopeptidase